MNNSNFQLDKVFWEKGRFKPWHITEGYKRKSLTDLRLKNDEIVLIIEKDEKAIGFLKKEVIYHHVVQGHIDDEAFMISYCVMCNAGVNMIPLVEKEYHLFEAVGVYNGQLLNQDLKTNSLWNHLRGECLHGEYEGKQLEVSYLKEMELAEAKSDHPNLELYISGSHKVIKNIFSAGMNLLDKVSKIKTNFLPSFFVKTIIEEDKTLPRMTKGLMVKINNEIKFYESNLIRTGMTDEIDGKIIRFFSGKIPYALDESDNRPFQIYMRWYAFKINYPEGQIFRRSSVILG